MPTMRSPFLLAGGGSVFAHILARLPNVAGHPCRVQMDVGRLARHAARPPCAMPTTPGRPRESYCRFVAGLCPATRSGVLRVALRTPRGETELTDVSPHPRTPVPLRCAKGGCGRVKFLSRPQETRLRAARLSPTSGSSPLSIPLSL